MASSKASSGNRSTIPYEVLHGMPVQHFCHVPYLQWLSTALSNERKVGSILKLPRERGREKVGDGGKKEIKPSEPRRLDLFGKKKTKYEYCG